MDVWEGQGGYPIRRKIVKGSLDEDGIAVWKTVCDDGGNAPIQNSIDNAAFNGDAVFTKIICQIDALVGLIAAGLGRVIGIADMVREVGG